MYRFFLLLLILIVVNGCGGGGGGGQTNTAPSSTGADNDTEPDEVSVSPEQNFNYENFTSTLMTLPIAASLTSDYIFLKVYTIDGIFNQDLIFSRVYPGTTFSRVLHLPRTVSTIYYELITYDLNSGVSETINGQLQLNQGGIFEL